MTEGSLEAAPTQTAVPTLGMRLGLALLAFVLFFCIAALQAHRSHAFVSELGAFPDEPAHYVTGLMAHDYLHDAAGSNPKRYAEDYYVHYPKIAIGHWPPVFYGIQAAWMSAFGVDRVSVIYLMCFLAALTALLVFVSLRPTCGPWIAFAAGVLFLLSEMVQEFTGMVMTEMPLALFSLAATLMFARYMTSGKPRHVIGFALLASLTIMTKGSGFCLALVPPFAILFARRFDVLKRRSLYVGALVVVVLCGPWYFVTREYVDGTWEHTDQPLLDYAKEAFAFFVLAAHRFGGWVLTVFFALGAVLTLIQREQREKNAALLALVVAGIVFHAFVPASLDGRHIVLTVAPWVMLAAWGMLKTARLLAWPPNTATAITAVVALAAFGIEAFQTPEKDYYGYRHVAERLIGDGTLEDSVILVSSDPTGDGLFVSEMAMHEQRPGHVVLRASKVLGRGDWMGRGAASRYATIDDIAAYLREIPVGIVVVDESMPTELVHDHHRQLRELVRRQTQRWVLMASYDVVRYGEHYRQKVHVYRQIGHQALPKKTLTIKDARPD